MARMVTAEAAQLRSAENKATDVAALRAIAQAAVDVELFTIPLYMTALYSIQGMHPITGKNTDFYAGRLWPGAKASAHPISGNDRAFNIVFSVFIQEMLHLQMAANMATAIGVTPTFTQGALQNADYGWTCYGAGTTVIPDIIDLKDTVNEDVTVELGPLDEHRIRLFLAIEQPEDDARAAIKPDKLSSYFPQVPFAGWAAGDALPMFGTIGWMYQCYYDYLSLRYDDGSSLFDAVFNDGAIQNDLFNNFSSGHPMREFMGFETTIALTDKAIAFSQMVEMMDAITDQGEGSEIKKPSANMFQAVMPRYQPRDEALRADYPSYSDKGVQIPSADAAARFHNDSLDHYERFQEVRDLIAMGAITTWDQRGTGNWTAKDLTSADYDGSNPYNLPTPDDIAGALNTLSTDPGAHQQLSLAVVGAIAGVTRVLDTFWSQPGQSFPFPSMVGSGDRMSIAWAVTGQTPDLSQGIGKADDVHKLYHACQGLVYDKDSQQDDPDIIIYHSCRGSNGCRSQGGCGFVQPVTGGAQGCGAASGCGTAVAVRSQSDRNTQSSGTLGAGKNLCGTPSPSPSGCGSKPSSCGTPAPSPSGCGTPSPSPSGCGTPTPSPSICGGPPPSTYYSAPGDNKCGTFGGCAVPISASQVFPNSGTMQLFDFVDTGGEWHAKEITFGPNKASIDYSQGEKVHDVAWKAYAAVMQTRGTPVSDEPPAPSTLRLVFPPST